MNRRRFIGLLGSLPLVGGLFSWERESEKDRFERLAREGPIRGESFDFSEWDRAPDLWVPPNVQIDDCSFYGAQHGTLVIKTSARDFVENAHIRNCVFSYPNALTLLKDNLDETQ